MNKTRIYLALLIAASSAHAASPKIIGGGDASSTPPWIASLQAKSGLTGAAIGHICGATLIDTQWALTAAHCVDGAGTAERTLLIGKSSNAVDEKNQVTIDQIIIHPGWKGDISDAAADITSYQDDIALLHLGKAQSVTGVTRATAAQQDSLTNDQDVVAMGWGATDYAGKSYPLTLQQVTLPYRGKAYSAYLPNHLFAGGFSDKGLCFGDSGGPLLIGNVQYGISSLVLGNNSTVPHQCANDSMFAGFTSVADYAAWIDAQLNGLNYSNYQHILVEHSKTAMAHFVIRNHDNVDWTISHVAADVTLEDNCSGKTLAPGSSCELVANYTGTTNGLDSKTITFTASSTNGTTQGNMKLDAETISVPTGNDAVDSNGGGSLGLVGLLGLGVFGWCRRSKR